MEESVKKLRHDESGDREILYSKTIKSGQRIYYLDVKKNLRDDLFLVITESKRVQPKGDAQLQFEKHKILIYREELDNFLNGLEDVIGFIHENGGAVPPSSGNDATPSSEDS
jgi:hypothetical protein